MGDNGLFSIAKKAAKDYKNAQDKELAGLNIYSNIIKDTLNNQDNQTISDVKWSNKNKVNMPKLANTGLIAVTIDTSDATSEVPNETESSLNKYAKKITAEQQQNESWYSYDKDTRQWANAVSADGSMWVWIPRFAYKITPKESGKQAGIIDVVFLKGTTDEPAETSSEGNTVTRDMIVRADATDTANKYIVHPAFTNESSSNYANGGWDKEISGFWMAKFEAGYVGEAGKPNTAKDSSVKLSTIYSAIPNKNQDFNKNYYGTRAVGDYIKYPTFSPSRPSMNYIAITDAYNLCRSIEKGKEVYGLSNIDSHLTKNSEWGAVAYLTHSKCGRNGNEITINNVSVDGSNTIYAVTGYGASSVSADRDTSRTNLSELTADSTTKSPKGNWRTSQGQLASTTGNTYGIYDLSGGLWEWTAGYIATTGDYGEGLIGDSTKYKTKYEHSSNSGSSTSNYSEANKVKRLGEAIWETSTAGSEYTGWNGDYSNFLSSDRPFSLRGAMWTNHTGAGIFSFGSFTDTCSYTTGFRAVLIAK